MNRKRLITVILCMVVTLSLSNIIFISDVKAIAAPTPVISGIQTSYMLGDKISFNLTSTGAEKLVQYKVVLTNKNTNEAVDLLNGYSSLYYNPLYKYSVTYSPKAAGEYALAITSKLGGYKEIYARTIVKDFKVLTNAMIIDRIDTISMKTNIGDAFVFPSKVTAVMKDSSKKELDVKWDNTNLNNSVLGMQTFYGKVNGFSGKVTLNVNVVDEKVVSIDSLSVSIDEGMEYKLTEKITAKVSQGTMEVPVKWEPERISTGLPGTYRFQGTVEGFAGKAELTLTINPVKLTLVSASASNLKEIVLSFNKRVDLNSVNDENIRLFKNATQIPTAIKLLSDEKTAVASILTSNTGMNKGERYAIAIEGIEDLNGNLIDTLTKDIVPEDLKAPEILSVYSGGPYNIIIEFSEPVKNTEQKVIEVKLGSSVIKLSPYSSGFDTSTLDIRLLTPMSESSIYDISLKNLEDFSGRKISSKTLKLAYKKNMEPITIKVDRVDPAYAVVSFSKPVRGLTKDSFYNTDSSKKALGIYSDFRMTQVITSSQFVNRVWVKFYDTELLKGNPILDTEQSLNVLAKANGYEIMDAWGNIFKGAVLPITSVMDKKPPEVVSLQVETESSLVVDFNEKVRLSTSNIEVYNSAGSKISVVLEPYMNNKFRIKLDGDYSGSSITVKLKNIDDKAVVPNRMLEYSEIVKVTDKTPPVVKRVVKRLVTGLDQALYIYFSEAVNDSALNIDNYYIQNPGNNLMVKLVEKPIFLDDTKIIKLPLTNEQKDFINKGASLFVKDIQDLYKNVLTGQIINSGEIYNYDASSNNPSVLKLEATEKNILVVTFNQYLMTVNTDVFSLNGRQPKSSSISVNKEGNTVVTLKTADNCQFSTGLEGTATLRVVNDSTRKIENIFRLSMQSGLYTTSTSVKIEDKIPPVVKMVSGAAQVKAFKSSKGIIETITIEYEEKIDAKKLSALSYTVVGAEIDKVYTNNSGKKGEASTGNFVIIELKNAQSSSNLAVKQALEIFDINGNKLLPDCSELKAE